MTIRERIKAARERRGMSQIELAKALRVQTKVCRLYEENRRQPDLGRVNKLCDALNVSADWLLGRIPDDRILLPRELTAENGAKAALDGKFKITINIVCPSCVGTSGFSTCEICKGTGFYVCDVAYPWISIQEVWNAAVAHFESQTNANAPELKS